jgi:hypothetical protein
MPAFLDYNSCPFDYRLRFRFMVFNATFNNISGIPWWSVLLVEENGVPWENHWPVPFDSKQGRYICIFKAPAISEDSYKEWLSMIP